MTTLGLTVIPISHKLNLHDNNQGDNSLIFQTIKLAL